MVAINFTDEIQHVFPLPFERNFDTKFHLGTTRYYFQAGCVCTVLYLILLYVGQFYMKNRPASEMRKALIIWNTILAFLSFWGTVRVLPELRQTLKHHGFRNSICSFIPEQANPVSAFWYYVFGMSKFLELGDTAFLVLRKKKLIFLHWFHHSSVLVFTFYMTEERAPISRWFVNMNYPVHSVMYGYFALRAAAIKVPSKFAVFITCAQILQMIAGFCLTISVFLWKNLGSEDSCPGMTSAAVNASMVIYSFYFLLFLNFFFKSYYKTRPQAVHIKVQ